jgi:hypothetical protein
MPDEIDVLFKVLAHVPLNADEQQLARKQVARVTCLCLTCAYVEDDKSYCEWWDEHCTSILCESCKTPKTQCRDYERG